MTLAEGTEVGKTLAEGDTVATAVGLGEGAFEEHPRRNKLKATRTKNFNDDKTITQGKPNGEQ